MRLLRSVAGKLVLLTAIFIAVPVLVYQQLRAADEEKTEILLQTVREQGRSLAISLQPYLSTLSAQSFGELGARLAAFDELRLNVKILLRPAQVVDASDYFYIASSPALPQEYRDEELAQLTESGILERLDESCIQRDALTHRYVNPAGESELLTSIVQVPAEAGCWLILTSNLASDFGASGIERPYWMRTQVQVSFGIYIAMAVVVLLILFDVRRNLVRFAGLARRIRGRSGAEASFLSANRIPELHGVAVEFDAMVDALKSSADAIRSTAEETAHALKTPIGVLAQAIEPLKRSLGPEDERGRRSVERMELAVERLGKLVDRNRRLEEVTAESVDPAIGTVDLGALCGRLAAERARETGTVALDFEGPAAPVMVRGAAALIESAFDNLLENAVSFSPPSGRVRVAVAAAGGFGELAVEDEGPGADPDQLDRIFERSFSRRPAASSDEHFGLGLWIVRRNAEALGGGAVAENRDEGGLRVVFRLPLDA